MLEVEVKYRSPDRDALKRILTTWGGSPKETRIEEDHYFNAPDRDFRTTDEAFRLRRIGPRNVLTYKGPKQDTATKTRTEIEVPLADGDATATNTREMLTALGYRHVTVVRKLREVWRFTRDGFTAEACFDDVDQVGAFVELEIQAESTDFERAKAAVLAAAEELGLTEMERRSYLTMFLAKAGER